MFSDYISTSNFDIHTDVDLRTGVHDILYGTPIERPRGVLVVLQRLKKDSFGNAIRSPYTYKLTGEGKADDRGPATTRTGFYCDEFLIRVLYQPASRMIMDELTTQTGVQPVTRDLVFVSAFDSVSEHDCIVFINLDDQGNVINPVTKTKEVIVTKVYPKNLDGGRIEYYACIVEEQK